jgi:hypothetical protein
MTKRFTNPDGSTGTPAPLRPGQDPSRAIQKLYATGRYTAGNEPAAPRGRQGYDLVGGDLLETKAGRQTNVQRNQCPEDAHAPGYDCDVKASSWLRSDGTAKPGFDHTADRIKRNRS